MKQIYNNNLWVLPVHEDGVRVPAEVEVEVGVAGLDVRGLGLVPRLGPVDVERDPNLAALGRREVCLVSSKVQMNLISYMLPGTQQFHKIFRIGEEIPVGPGVGSDLVVGGDIGCGAETDDTRGHGAAPVTLHQYSGLYFKMSHKFRCRI